MATLLLTAVGSAIAGPIGAAIGAMAGQRVDQALFGPKGRQGARLADLAVQASTYGARISRLYGRMRVSGTVIWATDLREERSKVSQGKGRPKATVYSYSASFAVQLSARRISGIGRIWADGKLLRGAAGDFKIETGFRIHGGAADQPVDPLIAAAEGNAAPAYRGRAYVVFEDMALESFGNRIPNLSFEVFADAVPVASDDIIADLAGSDVNATGGVLLDGYAADGPSVAAAIAPLNDLAAFDWTDSGVTVQVGRSAAPSITLAQVDLGAAADMHGGPLVQHKRAATSGLPSRLELGFADPDRDYQPGLQALDVHVAGRVLRTDLPAALRPEAAAGLAREQLFAARRDIASAEVRLPWRALAIWSAASVVLDDAQWRVRSVGLEGMCLVVHLSARAHIPTAALATDGGRILSEADLDAGSTRLLLADLPPVQDVAAAAPIVVVGAAGTKPGWRSAVLMQRAGVDAPFEDVGRTSAPATIGVAQQALAPASPHLMDLRSTVTIDLLHDGMALLSADDAALGAGANLALLGDELIQFGDAQRVSAARWTLSRLLRGRRGTERFIAGHQAEERFLLLDADSLTALTVPAGVRDLAVLAKGVGDADGVTASLDSVGAALRPLAPVRLHLDARPDGSVQARWVRRSREGWHWHDGVDVPLGEETELYQLEVSALPSANRFGVTLTGTAHLLSVAQIADLRSAGATSLAVSVRQIGRFALSDAATATLAL